MYGSLGVLVTAMACLLHTAAGSQCAVCVDGEYCFNDQNFTCPAHSTSGAQATNISQCVCYAGYFAVSAPNAKECMLCPPDSFCTGNDFVSSCPLHARSDTGASSAAECVCNAGFYRELGLCEQCSAGKYKTLASASCLDCKADTFSGVRGATEESVCVACPEFHQSQAGSSSASDCISMPGFFTDAQGVVRACPGGTYQPLSNQTACTACGGDLLAYVSPAGSNHSHACVPCPMHSHVLAAGAETVTLCACDAGYTSPQCSACTAGTYKAVTGSAECTLCASNTYSTQTQAIAAEVCLSCGPNAFSALGTDSVQGCTCNAGFEGSAGDCAPCAAGRIQNGSSPTACGACPVNTYEGDRTACHACPEHTSSRAGSASSADCVCDPGYEQAGVGVCDACRAGRFNALSNSTCQLCSIGSYAAGEGGIACTACPPNSKSLSEGSATLAACQCMPGYEGANGTCTACRAGFNKTSPLSGLCEACPANEYAHSTGALTCLACPPHSLAPAGSASVFDCTCVPGYISRHTVDALECIPCLPGSFTDQPGQLECSLCAEGKYSGAASSTACLECAADQYQDSRGASECTECPAHSVSAAGSTTRAACECLPGYAGCSTCAECTACAISHYKNSTANIACLECAAGLYTVLPGRDSALHCEICPRDHYVNGSGHCAACAANAASPPASVGMQACQCLPGFTGEGGEQCTECVRGTFKASAGSEACVPCAGGSVGTHTTDLRTSAEGACGVCDSGTFSSDVLECVPCPSNSTSDQGSSGIADCHCTPGFSGVAASGCEPCSVGAFKTERGSAACTLCPANSYGVFLASAGIEGCIQCPPHTVQVAAPPRAGISSCVCDIGYVTVATATCSACPPGKFSTAVSSPSCQSCPPGSYYPVRSDGVFAVDACSPCMPDAYSNASAYGIGQCVCVQGYLRSNNTCSVCPADYVCPDEGTRIACPAHTSAPAASHDPAQCACVPGFFLNETAGACQFCPVDFFCPGGRALLACPDYSSTQGHAVQTNISACICRPGYEQREDGSCAVCPSNSYCWNDNKFQCPPNSSSEVQSVDVEACQCDATFQRSADADRFCAACAPTELCTGQGRPVVQCKAGALNHNQRCVCGAGSFCANSSSNASCDDASGGAAHCQECPADHFCSNNILQACAGHMIAPPRSVDISACKCESGYYRVDGQCSRCPVGFFCHDEMRHACADYDPFLTTAGQGKQQQSDCLCTPGFFRTSHFDTCKLCPLNFYCPSELAMPRPNIRACPENELTLQRGAVSRQQCTCMVGFVLTEGSTDAMKCLPCQQGERCVSGEVVEELCHLQNRESSDDHSKCVCMPGFMEEMGECVACASGSFKARKGDFACSWCPIDHFWANTTTCLPCTTHARSPPGSLKCMCAEPYAMVGGECVVCGSDYYLHSQACHACPPHSSTNSRSAVVDRELCVCSSGMYMNASFLCEPCPAGTYEVRGRCQACGANASSEPGSNSSADCFCSAASCMQMVWGAACSGACAPALQPCAPCQNGTYKANFSRTGNTEQCEPCAPSSYQEAVGSTACAVCAEHETHTEYGASTRAACKCVAGYERNSSGLCQACPPGTFKNHTGNDACLPCAVGTFASGPNNTACLPCSLHTPITHANTTLGVGSRDAASCVCLPGMFRDGATCSNCVSGSFKSLPGLQPCHFCGSSVSGYPKSLVHHYGDGAEGATSYLHCLACPVHSGQSPAVIGSAANQSHMHSVADCVCFPGYGTEGSSACTQCRNYTYKLGFDSSSCLPCTDGTFFPPYAPAGDYACELCSLPEYGNISARHIGLAVNSLDAGVYWGVDESDCVCRLGFFRSYDACMPCPAGQIRDSHSSLQCHACPPDTFQDRAGQSVCSACPPSSTTLNRTEQTSIFECICDAGHAWDAASMSCRACVAGTYRPPTEVNSACASCPANFYCPQGASQPTACPLGEVSDVGSSSQDDCQCQFGSGRGVAGGPANKNRECSRCSPGSYSSGRSDTLCTVCPGNKNTSVGAGAVTDCLCIPGHGVSATANADAECSPCSNGFFASGGRNLPCVSCGWGAITEPPTAAFDETCCLCDASIGVRELGG